MAPDDQSIYKYYTREESTSRHHANQACYPCLIKTAEQHHAFKELKTPQKSVYIKNKPWCINVQQRKRLHVIYDLKSLPMETQQIKCKYFDFRTVFKDFSLSWSPLCVEKKSEQWSYFYNMSNHTLLNFNNCIFYGSNGLTIRGPEI